MKNVKVWIIFGVIVIGFFIPMSFITNNASAIGWQSQDSNTSYDLWGVDFVDSNNGWAVGSNGIIRHTIDGGNTWNSQNSKTTVWLSTVEFIDSDHGWISGDTGTILYTSDGGNNWDPQTSGTDKPLWDICFVDLNHGWAVGNGATVVNTSDGGVTWTVNTIDDPAHQLFSVDFWGLDDGWIVGSPVAGKEIFHTSDGGDTWNPQSNAPIKNLRGVDFSHLSHGWSVGLEGTILRTTNGGNDWVSQTSGTNEDLWGVFCLDWNNGWAVGGGGTILYTNDGGTNWNMQIGEETELLKDVKLINTNIGWTVGNSGTILNTTTGGNSLPTLSWTSEANYIDDGIHPQTGNTSIIFEYRVKYIDEDNETPEASDPKVHIKKGSVEISGSPFSMDFDSWVGATNDYTAGAIYNYSAYLEAGNDYTYYFTASDIKGGQITTSELEGPDVNTIPTLSSNYFTPSDGDTSTIYTFSIYYSDADDDAPITKYIYIDGTAYTMSTIDTTYSDGSNFSYQTTLTQGFHDYYFYFHDGEEGIRDPVLGEYTTHNIPESTQSGTLQGNVYISGTLDGISGVTVSTSTGGYSSVTDSNGFYSIVLDADTYSATASKANYDSDSRSVIIHAGETTTQNFYLEEISNAATISGYVYINNTSIGISDATVYTDHGGYLIPTSSDGEYVLGVSADSYTVTCSKSGFISQSKDITLSIGETKPLNFYLSPNPTINIIPVLTSGVSPSSGDSSTVFKFTANYSDDDDNPPLYVRIFIDGYGYTMSKQNPSDETYDDGCVYQYQTKLSQGSHSYYFEASDGINTTGAPPDEGSEIIIKEVGTEEKYEDMWLIILTLIGILVTIIMAVLGFLIMKRSRAEAKEDHKEIIERIRESNERTLNSIDNIVKQKVIKMREQNESAVINLNQFDFNSVKAESLEIANNMKRRVSNNDVEKLANKYIEWKMSQMDLNISRNEAKIARKEFLRDFWEKLTDEVKEI